MQYLDAQRVWIKQLDATLRQLDDAVACSANAVPLVTDLTLAWSLCASIQRHFEVIVAVWDSGRVTKPDTVKIVNLLWERLDGNLNSALAVSFVEACTLADALAQRLDERLAVGGAVLQARLDAVVALAADVEMIAARCREKILHAPKIAVPDPAVLGRVPDDPGARRAFEARLGRVEAAVTAARSAFEAPLARREELRQLLGAYADKAAKLHVGEHREIAESEAATRSSLWTAPCDLVASQALLDAYEGAIAQATDGGQ